METKFAVALLRGDEEKILKLFDTKEEADAYGKKYKISREKGLQYCFSSLFLNGIQVSDNIKIYDYYNVKPQPQW